MSLEQNSEILASDIITIKTTADNALPKSGGTMAGTIVRNGFLAQNSVDNNALVVRGGTDSTSAFSILYGKSHDSMPGVAGLVAAKDSQSAGLYVYPDGHATLNGDYIISENSSGKITFKNGSQLWIE